MEAFKDAFMAPFSTEAATATSPAKTAIAYGLLGLVVGAFLLK